MAPNVEPAPGGAALPPHIGNSSATGHDSRKQTSNVMICLAFILTACIAPVSSGLFPAETELASSARLNEAALADPSASTTTNAIPIDEINFHTERISYGGAIKFHTNELAMLVKKKSPEAEKVLFEVKFFDGGYFWIGVEDDDSIVSPASKYGEGVPRHDNRDQVLVP